MGMTASFRFNYDTLDIEASYDGSYGLAFELHAIPSQWLVSDEFENQHILIKVEDFLEHFKSHEPGYYGLTNFIKILTLAYQDTGERSEITVYNPLIKEFRDHPHKGSYKDCIIMTLGS